MLRALRWVSFFTITPIVNGLSVALQALYAPYFWFFVRGKRGEAFDAKEQELSLSELLYAAYDEDTRDTFWSDSSDDHGLMVHAGIGFANRYFARGPRHNEYIVDKAVALNCSLKREVPAYREKNPELSHDCLSAWVYFYVANKVNRPKALRRVVDHFIENVFSQKSKNGRISMRADCSGFNFVDFKFPFVSSPILPGRHHTGAALLTLAVHELADARYKRWLWIYNLITFAWFFRVVPWQYTKKNSWFDVAHVSQMGMFVQHKCGRSRRWGLNWVADKASLARGVPQPFVAAMSRSCGALSDELRDRAMGYLLSGWRVNWPQRIITKPEHLKRDDFRGKKLYAQMALAAKQLSV